MPTSLFLLFICFYHWLFLSLNFNTGKVSPYGYVDVNIRGLYRFIIIVFNYYYFFFFLKIGNGGVFFFRQSCNFMLRN